MITYKDYIQDLQTVSALDLQWSGFDGKRILITGATGLIGSYLVDVLGYRNKTGQSSCVIYVLSRSQEKLRRRFPDFYEEPWFVPVIQDIVQPLLIEERLDYMVNCASNAHPRAYAEDPVGTITTNVFGLNNLLEHAVKYGIEKFLELSSVEIYGSCTAPMDDFSENYCGYIDCNTMRAGYPESKRVCEALCQAFLAKHNIPVVIARPCRVYGPTMDMSDSKASAQFFKNVLAGQDIVLKSKGDQVFSYAYVADVVSAMLFLLLKGVAGEAYNIADPQSVVTLEQLADVIAANNDRKVVFDLPDDVESKGFSGAMRAVLLTSKMEALGWVPQTDIKAGAAKTISILKKVV